jgi:outer membrane receptor protein involved in Fe transport
MKFPTSHTIAALVATTLFGSTPARAQEASPAPATTTGSASQPAAREDEELVILNEFRVDARQDEGYLASNATSGTRLSMPVKELPMHLEVITRDFIEDIGAVNFKEALEYSAGVVLDEVQGSNNFLFSPSGTGQSNGTLRPDGTAVNIRGYNTRFVLRNGFRVDYVTDVVNVGRQELVRGPQSLLYGVSALGGIINVDPRYPLSDRRSTLRIGYGNEDFRRAEAYTTDRLVGSGKNYANYGLGVVYQKSSDYTEFNDRTVKLITPSIDWQINERVSLFVDAEAGNLRSEGTGFQDVNDAAPGAIRNEYGLAVNNQNVYGETMQVGRDTYVMGDEFRWSGPDTYQDQDYLNLTAQLNVKVTDNLSVLFGWNYQDIDQTQLSLDSQSTSLVSSATRPTTPGIWTDAGVNPLNTTQHLWKTVQYQWGRPDQAKETTQYRAEVNYTFDLLGAKHGLLGGWQKVDLWQMQESTAQVTRADGTDGNRSFSGYADLSRIRYQDELVRPFRDQQFEEFQDGYYLVYNGRFWKERINVIAGYRRDEYLVRDLYWTYGKADTTLPDSNVPNWRRPENYDDISGYDANNNPIFNNPGANAGSSATSTPGSVPKVDGYRFGGKTQTEDSPSLGVSFALSENLNVFAMTGTGVFPNSGQRDGLGNAFEAERTQGIDIGLKADLWKNDKGRPRVSLQVGAYKIERENAIYNVFWAPQPRSNNRDRARTGGVPAGGRQASGTGPNAYSVYSSGWQDFETDLPVTYLLPLSYVPEADRTHPRVAGAPQLNGYVLVDYASLGTPTDDPLRRAMDAAANDPSNLTALQTASTGSGATGLYANNGYALNRNSDVAYDDMSRGVDVSTILNISRNYTATFTYSYTHQEVTGGFNFVDQPASTEYDSWWNYMGAALEDRAANPDESSYSIASAVAGARTIDVPEHQVATWNKYTFTEGKLKGLDLGLGITWKNERQAQVAIDNGLRTNASRENTRTKPYYPADTKVNAAIGYRFNLGETSWRVQLNLNNVLSDNEDVAYDESILYINPTTGTTVPSTTPGAQQITVPERARIVYKPFTYRLTATMSF